MGDSVAVTDHEGYVPSVGPATQHLGAIIEGTATPEERSAFAEGWHERVRSILTDDELFTVLRRDA